MANPNITLLGASYTGVSGVTLPKTGGGTATFPFVEGSQTITQNGTVDVTNLAEVIVNVAGGGGGYGYTKLGSVELEVNTTSTSNINQGSVTSADAWTKYKIIYCRVRDKAGKRNGYLYGTDVFFININAGTGVTNALTTAVRFIYRYNNNKISMATGTGYGIYAYNINTSGRVLFYSKYNSTNSLTINGTYLCEVYALDWPDGASPFA